MRELAPGVVLAGYRIDSLVGRGGMGVVYRALQLELERVVALKVIAPELLDDKDVRRRFLAEARAAAGVDHPNVIPVHAAGEEDGIAYIAMRYVAGDDLRTRVRRGGAMDPAEAADLVAQAGAALDAIHRAGFVHRDVKPANLLVDVENHVYLTDFGLAKTVLTHSGGTRTGQWVGTLDYVAPEQIRGGRIDARADVYALGGVLHYALTGHVPFEREGDEAKLWAQLSAPPPVPSAVRRGLRSQFDTTVVRAMAKEPDARFPSAGDLGRAARAAAIGRTPSEPERMVARGAAAPDEALTEPGLAAEASTRTAMRVPAPPRPRRRAPALAAVATLAVVALAALVVATRDGRGEPNTAVDPTPTPTATSTPRPAQAVEVETIQHVSDRPSAIALVNGDAWLMSAHEPWLTRVSTATDKELKGHPKAGSDTTEMAAYRGDVWVALGAPHQVVRLDGRTGKRKGRISVEGEPWRLAVDRTGVWVGTRAIGGGPGLLLRYDRGSGKLERRLIVNEGIQALAAADGAIWVVKQSSQRLARMRPHDDALVDWQNLPGDARSISYGDHALWIAMVDQDTVAQVSTRAAGQMVTASAGHAPSDAILAGGKVYVASRDDHTVVILDPASMTTVGKPIHVGLNPVALAADDRSIWVTAIGDSSLSWFDYR